MSNKRAMAFLKNVINSNHQNHALGKTQWRKAALASVIALSLVGCGNNDTTTQSAQDANLLFTFEQADELNAIVVKHADKSLTSASEASNSDKSLQVVFNGLKHHEASVVFQAESAWDWSAYDNFGLSFDIANPEASSVHVYISVTDTSGKAHNRNVVIPAKSAKRYVLELAGHDLNIETGIRSNPFSWETDAEQVIWRYGNKNIDLANVASISFKVNGVPEDKTLIFDNIAVVEPKSLDENYLVGLVDKFGQSTKIDSANKVSTVEELVAISDKEQASLSYKNFADRSQFNGWKNGPKLEATGYYRVDKYQDKWTLVDPEGYLFYSNGIANVRMANTTTITGYDFDQQHIKQREPGDLTPEDSIGLNQAPAEAWPTRHVSSQLRANMFSWLPSYDEPMGQHFGYRREVHTGAIPKGETYSFYQANLARKYQTNDVAVAEQKWRDTTIKRMQSWGFTSFGNWIDPSFYQLEQYPYFANGWIIGNFKTVSSGNDYWSPLPDPFDPVFKERAFATVKQVSAEVLNSPWCVGVFIDNEKSWGQMGQASSQYGVPISALKLSANDSPAKAHFSQLMKDKYQSIRALNEAWQLSIASWEAFDNGIELSVLNDAVVEDLSTMLYQFGRQYFQVVNNAMDEYMPNHLYMGVRFATWGMTPELRKAAAEVLDVVSYNYYKEVINEDFWQFLAEVDMPSIIGEFHNGALDSGLLNPGLIHAESQADRGKKYAEYVNSAIDNPYFVGTHWFQYIDSPLTGRALDGENYNVGFVSVTDIPYQPLVDAVKKVNKSIYTRRFGDAEK